ncbi:MAG: UDP-3-O-acyl-N-acetylglucosamine deacetylase [Elusimicrobiota bacterium]
MKKEKADFQKTVSKEISFEGIGIHSGEKAEIKIKPAPAGSGIFFIRKDMEGDPEIPALIEYVSSSHRSTVLKRGSAEVMTVEHLLAAAYAMGIDNLCVELKGKEMPALDGSAKEYAQKIKEAGTRIQEAEKTFYTVSSPVSYAQGESVIIALPSDKLTVKTAVSYNEEFPKPQYAEHDINEESFINEIAPARTYCFEKEIEYIKKNGLGKGGSKDNTVVIGENEIKNTALRFNNELARHKILDFLGDICLLGKPLKAHITAVRSGHSSNKAFALKLKDNIVKNETQQQVIDAEEILKILPHRYPFLMVDRIVIGDSGKDVSGYKNVTVNEPFFKGHFPGRPVFPASLIVEFMAQSSAVLFLANKKNKNTLAYFMIIEKTRFFKEVRPPDVLRSEVKLLTMRSRRGKVRGAAYTQKGEKAAEAQFMFSLVEN